MLSRWTIGAIASKKASWSCPVSAMIDCARPGRCKRAGGDDRGAVGKRVDPLADEFDIGMRLDRAGDALREAVAIHRQRRAGGHAVRVAFAQDQRTQRAHLGMQQPDRVLLGIVGAEAVRADQFGELVGLVRGGAFDAAHFAEAHLEAGLGELPGGFGSGEAAADDVDVVHGAAHSAGGQPKEPLPPGYRSIAMIKKTTP